MAFALDGVGDAVDLDATRTPALDAGEVVEDQRGLAMFTGEVFPFARSRQIVAADNELVVHKLEVDRIGVRLSVVRDGRQPQQAL